MKQLPILFLKACLCVGASLFWLYVPSGFGGRLGSALSIGHVFQQGALAATALVGCRVGVRGARARARCKPWLFLYSVAVTALLGLGASPEGLDQKF